MSVRVDDRVTFRVGRWTGAGVVEEIDGSIARVRQDDGVAAFPMLSECTPVEDAPEFVLAGAFEEATPGGRGAG